MLQGCFENGIITELHFNKTDDALHSIAEFLRSNAQTTVVKRKTQMPAQNPTGLGVALLSIGLGLLAAWAFSNDRHW